GRGPSGSCQHRLLCVQPDLVPSRLAVRAPAAHPGRQWTATGRPVGRQTRRRPRIVDARSNTACQPGQAQPPRAAPGGLKDHPPGFDHAVVPGGLASHSLSRYYGRAAACGVYDIQRHDSCRAPSFRLNRISLVTKPLPSAVFKAYDIRGIVPEQLNPDFARLLGRALAIQARTQGVDSLVIGYDGRLSSPALADALHAGANSEGMDTVDIGMVPTPLVYFTANVQGSGSGIAITGSHNPPDYNGFKMMLAGRTLYGPDIQALHTLMESLVDVAPQASQDGQRKPWDIKPEYVQRIVGDLKLKRPMRIALDCGNGLGG